MDIKISSYDVVSTTNPVLVFCKTKKLFCFCFPAEPSVVSEIEAERRTGGKGAAGSAAAELTLAAEHRSAMRKTDGGAGAGKEVPDKASGKPGSPQWAFMRSRGQSPARDPESQQQPQLRGCQLQPAAGLKGGH